MCSICRECGKPPLHLPELSGVTAIQGRWTNMLCLNILVMKILGNSGTADPPGKARPHTFLGGGRLRPYARLVSRRGLNSVRFIACAATRPIATISERVHEIRCSLLACSVSRDCSACSPAFRPAAEVHPDSIEFSTGILDLGWPVSGSRTHLEDPTDLPIFPAYRARLRTTIGSPPARGWFCFISFPANLLRRPRSNNHKASIGQSSLERPRPRGHISIIPDGC